MMINFPEEIWENILKYCDGKTLIALQRTSDKLKNLIKHVDKRREIWHYHCKSEIPAHELTDVCQVLCPNGLVPWKVVFGIWYRWKLMKNWTFIIKRLPGRYLSIAELKTSGVMIVVGDECGFSILNSVTCTRTLYKIGAVKHIELFIRPNSEPTKNTKFKHNTLDCTLVPEIHYFFDVNFSRHIRKNKYEKSIIRYSGDCKIILPMRSSTEASTSIIEADIFKNDKLIVTTSSVSLVTSTDIQWEVQYRWGNVRCWFLWQARVLFSATENSFDLLLDGRLRQIFFQGFAKVSAIYYFCGVLFLGTATGSLYIYHSPIYEIWNLDLENYVFKIHVCSEPLVAIRVVENGYRANEAIIVSSAERIYRISP